MFDLASLHVFANVSRRDIECHITLQKVIHDLRSLPETLDHTAGNVTPSLRDALAAFGPQPPRRDYQICPRCHAHYALHREFDLVEAEYTKTCTRIDLRSIDVSATPCGNPLLDDHGHPKIHLRYFPIASYVGALLSVPLLESAIEATNVNIRRLIAQGAPNWVSDISESAFVRGFTLPGSSIPFLAGSGDVLRLLFNVFVDFFNSEGQRIRGKKASTGLISLHCINLPGALRHHFPHISVLIEGPFEPNSIELQNYIEIVVNDLLSGHESGYYFTRTANHPNGRPVEWALAIHIADLVANRASMGFINHNARIFCAHCDAWDVRNTDGVLVKRSFTAPDGRHMRQWKYLLGRWDWEAWRERSQAIMNMVAEEYRDTLSYDRRRELWATHGLRWSEWRRIPNFNTSLQSPIEPAHVLLLGVVQWLVRRALKLSDLDAERRPRKEKAFTMDLFSLPEAVVQGWPQEKQNQVIRVIDKLTTWLQPDDDDEEIADEQATHRDIVVFNEEQLRRALSSHTKPVLDAVLTELVERHGALRSDAVGTAYTISHIVTDLIEWVCLPHRHSETDLTQIAASGSTIEEP
jgi:hypothetical protein